MTVVVADQRGYDLVATHNRRRCRRGKWGVETMPTMHSPLNVKEHSAEVRHNHAQAGVPLWIGILDLVEIMVQPASNIYGLSSIKNSNKIVGKFCNFTFAGFELGYLIRILCIL